jgi:3-hydroxyisobutyrate dehydrogenase
VLNQSHESGSSFTSVNVFGANVCSGAYATGFMLGLMAKDVRIAQRVIEASGTDAPVLALTDERWAKALGDIGPGADQSKAHQAWWGDKIAED